MNEIQKHMKKYVKPEELDETHWGEDGADHDHTAGSPTLQVKASTLAETGVLHLQFSCPDVAGLHDDMKQDLGTCIINGEKALRPYGVAFNIRVPHTSLDETLLKQLGDKANTSDDCIKVRSFASKTTDYVKMIFRGVIEARDNHPEQNLVQALDFRIGHEDHRMCIGFSNMTPTTGEWNDIPHLNPIWFAAWLTSRYLVTDTMEEEE